LFFRAYLRQKWIDYVRPRPEYEYRPILHISKRIDIIDQK